MEQLIDMATKSCERNNILVAGVAYMGSEVVLTGVDEERGSRIAIIISDAHTNHVYLGKKYITAHAHSSMVGECIRQERHVGLFE